MKMLQSLSSLVHCSKSFCAISFGVSLLLTPVTAHTAVVVGGDYTFSAISNQTGGGQIALTGGETLKVYGGAGSGTSDTQSVYLQFDPVSLSVGQSIRVEFSLLGFSSVASASSMRLAIGNMPTSTGDTASLNPNWSTGLREGYLLWLPASGTSTSSTGDIVFRKYSGIQNPLSGSGANNVQLGTAAGSYALANGSQTTKFVFEITRTTDTTVSLSGTVGSLSLSVTTDETDSIFDFNTIQIGLRSYNDERGFEIGDFSVIPEPRQTSLLGASILLGIGIVLRRRMTGLVK